MSAGTKAIQDAYHVIDKDTKQSEVKLKCYATEFAGLSYKTVEELFAGFDTLKVITFSYEIGFIDKILNNFQYSEIILGAKFLYDKDQKLKKQLIEHLTSASEIPRLVCSHKNWVDKMREGNLVIRCASFLDHRKIFLLKSDSGRTRVIIGSANMTHRAWNGEQIEDYIFDDTIEAYEQFNMDFNTAWDNSIDIPYIVVSSKQADDSILDDNIIIREVKERKEVNTAIVLQQPAEPDIEFVQYTIDHESLKEKWTEIVGEFNPKAKNGMIELKPINLVKLVDNFNRIKQQKEVAITEKPRPQMTYDLDRQKFFLDGEEINLTPEADEVKQDIDILLEVFGNFDDFVVDDSEKFKLQHFKLLNYMFASPFIARLRCILFLHEIGTTSLPMFLLVASKTANSGKSFMVELILKMMTGAPLKGENMSECTSKVVGGLINFHEGTPFFVDEIDNSYMAHMKNIIKNSVDCEKKDRHKQPLVVFASNSVIDPDETLRKRLVYLNLNAALPSGIDQNAYINKGKAITARIGTAFYREYLRDMLQEMAKLIDFIQQGKNSEDWYPDIVAISSDIIVRILQRYNITIPSYIRKLTWNDDYFGAKCVAQDTLHEITEFYKQNKQAFKIQSNLVIVELGNDSETKALFSSWRNTLPTEVNAHLRTHRDTTRLIMKRKELEAFLHLRFNENWLAKLWNR